MTRVLSYLLLMRLGLLVTVVLLLCSAIAAVPVSAERVNAPPGLSGVDEYLETVPGAEGAERTGGGSLENPEVAAKALQLVGARTLRDLQRAGKDGQRAAALAANGAPTGSGAGGSARTLLGDGTSRGAVGGVATVLTGGAGAGWVLPAGLITMTILLIAAGLWRRRAA